MERAAGQRSIDGAREASSGWFSRVSRRSEDTRTTEEGGEKLREGSLLSESARAAGTTPPASGFSPSPGAGSWDQGAQGGSGRNLPGSLLRPAWWTGRHFLLL